MGMHKFHENLHENEEQKLVQYGKNKKYSKKILQ